MSYTEKKTTGVLCYIRAS